ncbi:spermine oxidase-like isoform X2 [Diorhabda carinulata]|uniref:spermine oxidase-like isoform X2 n=1 Tax=Diorhabda carinulata TaxID=1163345 RepID=UPI0025A1F63E|nr:spermine oxidase-like isoform X2 [Diorhabda carinulata]
MVHKMSNSLSVLIIGAGVAGISAACKLLEHGITNVTILEAKDRIGGRVHSVEFDGSYVDLGGQWVHGEDGNIVYDLVKDFDLLGTSLNTYEDNTYYLSDGSVVDKNLSDKIFEIGYNVLYDEEDATKYPGPYGDYFIKRYNEKIVEEFKSDKEILKLAKYFEHWFHKFYTCLDPAKTWFDISTHGALSVFKQCDGNQQLNWKKRGFKTILDVLMKKFPDESKCLPVEEKIFLKKEVNKIIWDDTTEASPTVRCFDGTSYKADHILITTSVGVLKKLHKSLFEPRLPAYKVNSIEHISLGVVNKILLKFPTKWWPDDTLGFSLLWNETDSLNLVNEVPAIGPIDENRCWLEDVFGFYVIDSHPRVLLGWVVGKMASEVEYMSDEDIIASCMFVLRKFLGKLYDIPDADGVLRSKWGTDPHFCGSYVYVSMDQEKHNASAKDLSEPLVSKKWNTPTLLFAGEATSAQHYSTVNGAIETGFREAERIINLYKN